MARQSKMASLTTKQLKAELARRQKRVPKLLKMQAKLEQRLEAIYAQIADVSGDAVPAGTLVKKAKGLAPKRKASRTPPREGSLKWHLVKALAGKKGLSIAEAIAAVSASGYKSQSRDFRLLVNQTLLNEPEFKKVKRGTFTVKSQPVAEKAAKDSSKPSRKPKAKAGRGRGGKPLAAHVQEALVAAPRGMTVREIEKAVLAAGYVTKGKNLYNPIGAVLAKGGFKKVSRGVYAVAKKPGRKPGKNSAAAKAKKA
ncbi:MAG: hypothetical protein NT031_15625 [Planctomycetota bacterium]|nr:hypothetical protein [Planctomycetota bacterium]